MGCLRGGVLSALLIAGVAAAAPELDGGVALEPPDAGSLIAAAASPEPERGGAADALDAGSFATAAVAVPDTGPFVTVVRGERPARTELREGELEEVPGALGDPIRAVMAMPGVSSVHSGVS